MSRLNPLSAADRRITAYAHRYIGEELDDGWGRVYIDSFDCWGKKQGGTYKGHREELSEMTELGWISYVTLQLMKRGCCPVITEELSEIARESGD